MTILTKEQIDLLNYKQSKEAVKALNKAYPLDIHISKITKEIWKDCDDICNTLLWLEDRIRQFEDPRMFSMDPEAEIIETKPKVQPPKVYKAKPVRPQRKFRALDTVYASVYEASTRTGIKVGTLRSYTSRKPDRYSWVD